MLLICVLVWDDNALGGEVYDTDVQPETPVLDVPDVSLDSLFHLPKFLGFTTIAGHLCPSRDARFGEMAHHVLVNDGTIYLSVMQHVRSWTYDAHVSLQHVDELWELIDVGLSHEVAKGELARVVLGGLHQVGILVDVHGAELQTLESLAVQSRSCLTEKDRSRTLNLDDECDDGQEWKQTEADDGADNDVEGAFGGTIAKSRQGLLVIRKYALAQVVLRFQAQLILTKLSRQVVEVNHVLVTILHQANDVVGIVVR